MVARNPCSLTDNIEGGGKKDFYEKHIGFCLYFNGSLRRARRSTVILWN